MGKRRISSEDLSSEDDYSVSALPKATKPKAKQQPAKKKSKATTVDDELEESVPQLRSHSSYTHTIPTPVPIRVALLEWYGKVHETRGMPWRKPYDSTLGRDERAQRAYEVWISEIMLQQTQVATVIPYYNKWMKKFPTIRDLAASEIETVNGLWKGLGYYSRAARILAGAQKAVKEFNGRLPNNAKDMEAEMPGIGRYSAGAICSIAYGECVPVLDGNVNRLLSRLLALYASPKAKSTLDVLWGGATSMVEEADRPGDINQALIELGSTVCKVREPLCQQCPLRPWCKAYELSEGKNDGGAGAAEADVPDIEELCTLCEPLPLPEGAPGLVTAFPMKAERKKAREELDVVNVIEWRHDGERWFLLVRRPEGGLLAGLHEFPTSDNLSGAAASASAQTKIPHALLRDLLITAPDPYVPTNFFAPKSQSAGASSGARLQITKIKPAGDVVHVFSHIRKTYRVQWVLLEGGGNSPPELAPNALLSIKKQSNRKLKSGSKGKGKGKKDDSEVEDPELSQSEIIPVAGKWTLLSEVADANIGTGVLKVWNQTKMLWEKNS